MTLVWTSLLVVGVGIALLVVVKRLDVVVLVELRIVVVLRASSVVIGRGSIALVDKASVVDGASAVVVDGASVVDVIGADCRVVTPIVNPPVAVKATLIAGGTVVVATVLPLPRDGVAKHVSTARPTVNEARPAAAKDPDVPSGKVPT